jgi:hypothetical protein
VPQSIDGPVLISADFHSGFLSGPGVLNPWNSFRRLRPTANIDGVLVYDGHFEIPCAAALNRATKAGRMMKNPEAALAEARAGVALCPSCIRAQLAAARALKALKRPEEARAAIQAALDTANGLEPAYREIWVPRVQAQQ